MHLRLGLTVLLIILRRNRENRPSILRRLLKTEGVPRSGIPHVGFDTEGRAEILRYEKYKEQVKEVLTKYTHVYALERIEVLELMNIEKLDSLTKQTKMH